MAIELYKTDLKTDVRQIDDFPNVYEFDAEKPVESSSNPYKKSRLDEIFDKYQEKQLNQPEPEQIFDVQKNVESISQKQHYFSREDEKYEKLYQLRAKLILANFIFFAIGLLSVVIYNIVLINNLKIDVILAENTVAEVNTIDNDIDFNEFNIDYNQNLQLK